MITSPACAAAASKCPSATSSLARLIRDWQTPCAYPDCLLESSEAWKSTRAFARSPVLWRARPSSSSIRHRTFCALLSLSSSKVRACSRRPIESRSRPCLRKTPAWAAKASAARGEYRGDRVREVLDGPLRRGIRFYQLTMPGQESSIGKVFGRTAQHISFLECPASRVGLPEVQRVSRPVSASSPHGARPYRMKSATRCVVPPCGLPAPPTRPGGRSVSP